ncbi:MAG: hypothetical protein ACYTFA_16750, partial [Planctomycetota bacterium]
MTNSKRALGLFASLCFGGCITLISCDGSQEPGNMLTDQTGKLRVLITDKPYPYEFIKHAIVTITRVEIRRSDSGDEL